MPVYYRHKIVHIHIPKTAGTAIENLFHRIGDMEWNPKSWVGQARLGDRWYEYQHLTLGELRRLADSNFSGFTSFAVVRDPYTRLISDFEWRKRVEKSHPLSPTQFFDSFDDFLDAIPEDVDSRWSEHIRGADQAWANFLIHVRPQYHYLTGERGECIVDAVLRFENLHLEMGGFLEPFGLRAGNIRPMTPRDPDEYFSRAQVKRIRRIYAADFGLPPLERAAAF